MDAELGQRMRQWEQALLDQTAELLPDGEHERVDIHVHLGIDSGSGEEMTLEAIDEQLRVANVDRAVLIPLNASDGYRVANDRLAEVAAESDGRYEFLARVDPAQVDLEALEGWLDAGAAGLKLHPQSDDARPDDPRLRAALELAAARQAIVLVHAGIDVDGVTDAIFDVARQLPDARFVVGHVAADRLAGAATRMRDVPNVAVCTAWWGPADMAWAFSWGEPGRFVFGSDPPYGSTPLGLALSACVARCVGWDDDALVALLGGNAAALLEGRLPEATAEPTAPDPSPEHGLLARLPAHWQRCYVSLEVAAAMVESKADPGSQLQLADAALEDELIEDELRRDAELVRRGIALARDLHDAGDSRHAYVATVGALTLAGTAPILAELPRGPRVTNGHRRSAAIRG
jgi:predicted TIM-barrel fold metal-dependent hydrolase